MSELNKLGYSWGTHYLPHDGNHVRQGMLDNISPMDALGKLGLTDIEIVPVVPEIGHGIQATRDSFSTCWFDESSCKSGIIHLDSYRKRWNRTTARFGDKPVHDVHSECADAFRQFGQMKKSGNLDRQSVELNFDSEW